MVLDPRSICPRKVELCRPRTGRDFTLRPMVGQPQFKHFQANFRSIALEPSHSEPATVLVLVLVQDLSPTGNQDGVVFVDGGRCGSLLMYGFRP